MHNVAAIRVVYQSFSTQHKMSSNTGIGGTLNSGLSNIPICLV